MNRYGIKQYIVDAFTEHIFSGNPAAVCMMERFPSNERMMKIAQENNLSETAFVRERLLISQDFCHCFFVN